MVMRLVTERQKVCASLFSFPFLLFFFFSFFKYPSVTRSDSQEFQLRRHCGLVHYFHLQLVCFVFLLPHDKVWVQTVTWPASQ